MTHTGADTTVLDLLGGSARQVAGKMFYAVLENFVTALPVGLTTSQLHAV